MRHLAFPSISHPLAWFALGAVIVAGLTLTLAVAMEYTPEDPATTDPATMLHALLSGSEH